MRNYQPQDEPIPGYRLQKPLGQGSFGQVWKALGPGDVEVALKIIRGLDGRYAIREWQSLQNVMNLRQPNLVAVFGVWLKDDSGKVLKKEEILALIPPEPAPAKEPVGATTSIQGAKPGWAAGKRPSTSVVQHSATLASPDSGTMRAVEPKATTQGSSSTPAEVGSAESGSSPLPSESGSGGSGGSGSDALSRALHSAKIPPLELVTAMTLGEGTLMDRLKAYGSGGIPRPELLSYMRDATRGVQFLNQNDVHHCDIKPENLMIVGGSVQVCDYGSALKAIYSKESRTHQGVTREYAAPEQLTGRKVKMHKSTDQYALAMTYYALRTGKYPWPDDGNEPIEVIKHSESYDFSDLEKLSPWTFELDVIRRALRRNPDDRFPTLGEFMDELDQAAAREQQAQREKVRGFWRKLSLAACFVLVVGLGGAGWYFRDHIRNLIQPRPPATEILALLKEEVPDDRDFEAAIRKLKQAGNSDRAADLNPAIPGFLEGRLRNKLDAAKNSSESEQGPRIDKWLAIASSVPAKFQTSAHADMVYEALVSKPLPRDVERDLAARLKNADFSAALKWSADQTEAPSLRARIRRDWLKHANGQCKVFHFEGLDSLLHCHQQTSSTPAEMHRDLAAALSGYLAGAEGLLSGTADDWKTAAEKFRLVQSFLSKNQDVNGPLNGFAQPSFGDQAALGELSVILRQNELSTQEWNKLAGKLRDPGDSAPRFAARYKLLLAAYADKQSSSAPERSPLDLPLLQKEVLAALEQLSEGQNDLADWEQVTFSQLQVKLANLLAEHRTALENTPQETAILSINKDAAIVISLLRAEDALRKPTPDFAAAEKALQEAKASISNASQQPRLDILILWSQFADRDQWQSLVDQSDQMQAGLEAFIDSKNWPHEGPFLDAIFFACRENQPLGENISSILDRLERRLEDSRLLTLVRAQPRLSRVRDWLTKDELPSDQFDSWKSLSGNAAILAKSPQGPTSPFRSVLLLLPAAMLESMARRLDDMQSADASIKASYSELAKSLSVSDVEQGPAVLQQEDRDYLAFVRDLSLATWSNLKDERLNPGELFDLASSSSPLLNIAWRRRLAVQRILHRVDSLKLPTDDSYMATPDMESMTLALRRLKLAELWVKDIVTADEKLSIDNRFVRARAFGKLDAEAWKEIGERAQPLLSQELRPRWEKENVLGQLLLIAGRGSAEIAADESRRALGAIYFAEYLNHFEKVSGRFRASSAISDLLLFTDVVLPGIRLAEQARVGNESTAQLRQAYATLNGWRGTLIKRDRNREIAEFLAKQSGENPIKLQLKSFEKAGELESNPKVKARWLVEQAIALRYLRGSSASTDPAKQMLDLANAALELDKQSHAAHAVLGYTHIQMARQLLYTDEGAALELLDAASKSLETASELLSKCQEEEVNLYGAIYLEDRSTACLETAYLQKVTGNIERVLGTLEKSRDFANEAITNFPGRSDPSNALLCLANALEDFAHHGVVAGADVDKYFGQAITQFKSAIDLCSTSSSAIQGRAEFNLGRCYMRYGLRGKLNDAEREDYFRQAAEFLTSAAQKLEQQNDHDQAAEARFFLLQVAYSRILQMAQKPKTQTATINEFQQVFAEAAKQGILAIKSANQSTTKRNLSLYRHDDIAIAYLAAQVFRKRTEPQALDAARQWRDKFRSAANAFISTESGSGFAAAPNHKYDIVLRLRDSENWVLPINPVPAEQIAVSGKQAALLESSLVQFPRGSSDLYRLKVLKLLCDSEYLPPEYLLKRPQWLADVRSTAEDSKTLTKLQQARALAFVEARDGLSKIAEAKRENQPEKVKRDLAREGMRSLHSAAGKLRSAMKPNDPKSAEALSDYLEYLGRSFNYTTFYFSALGNEYKQEKIEHLTWLISEYDSLKGAYPNNEFVIRREADRNSYAADLKQLRN